MLLVIVLAAHGTSDPAGARAIDDLAGLVRAHGVPVRVAYADVRAPDVTTVLRALRGRPVVVVPAFIAAGYHVRVDIPAQIEASGHRAAVLAESFGGAPELLGVLCERLRAAGYRSGDRVVLAAAGSSEPRALSEVDEAATALAARLRTPVRVGYAATAHPTVAEAVAAARTPGRRIAVASWLLAPGLFHHRAMASGAELVTAPLAPHPRIADLVLRRYQEARHAQAA